MRNKDTGEFELVVGDKQLLSGFFIGVLLLAVVFAMGYVLGQSSPKSAKVAPETAAIPTNSALGNSQQTAPPAVAASPEPAAAAPPTQTADTGQSAATPPVEAPPQPTTVPARDANAPAAPPKAPPAPARETRAPVAPPKAEPVPDQGNVSYWQVLAGSQTSADGMVRTLKEQGFPALTRPGPNNLILVWVGPYANKESLTRAKKKLEDAGITNLYKKP